MWRLSVICALFLLCVPLSVVAHADGLVTEGRNVAIQHCGRCHVVDASNRMGGIGSTPSFKLLRSMEDWEERFTSFFARNPHPAFVSVEGLTLERKLPPNAAPFELSARHVDALMAFVRTMQQE